MVLGWEFQLRGHLLSVPRLTFTEVHNPQIRYIHDLLKPTDEFIGVQLQFPIAKAYAIADRKLQGQTYASLRVDLKRPNTGSALLMSPYTTVFWSFTTKSINLLLFDLDGLRSPIPEGSQKPNCGCKESYEFGLYNRLRHFLMHINIVGIWPYLERSQCLVSFGAGYGLKDGIGRAVRQKWFCLRLRMYCIGTAFSKDDEFGSSLFDLEFGAPIPSIPLSILLHEMIAI
jgi:hypothetical protein